MPLRAAKSEEIEGLDIIAHGEEAYMHIGGSSPVMREKSPMSAQSGLSTARADA